VIRLREQELDAVFWRDVTLMAKETRDSCQYNLR